MSDEDVSDEQAQAVADLLDGKPAPELPERMVTNAVLLKVVLDPRAQEKIARVKARLVFRREPRWGRRIAIAASMAAAALLVTWFVVRTPSEPNPELAQAEAEAAAVTALAEPFYRSALGESRELTALAPVYARADAALAARDFAAAREALETLKGGVLERDAAARLATVELRAARPDAAIAEATRGLALAAAEDVFTLNLRLARAAGHRARGELTASRDDVAAARRIVEALIRERGERMQASPP